MRLSEAVWTEIADFDGDLALLSVGNTEQHGPRMPLGTDTLSAESIAEVGTDVFDGKVAIDLTIPVNVTEEYRAFDGTFQVSPDTFRAYVHETIESLAHHGFDRVVVANGHGGNIDIFAELCRRVS